MIIPRFLRFVIPVVAFACVGAAYGAACVPLYHTIHYTCGDGTLASGKSLPADLQVEYGKTVSHRSFDFSICNAPAGTVFAGYNIFIGEDDTSDIYVSSLDGFTYYYTSDMTVAMRFAPLVPDPADVWAHVLDGQITSNSSSKKDDNFTLDFYYGQIGAEIFCSSTQPQNEVVGFPAGGNLKQNIFGSGRYCYCRVTSPVSEQSPWVFANDHGGWFGGTDCNNYCANKCSDLISSNISFRLAIFAGFMPQ